MPSILIQFLTIALGASLGASLRHLTGLYLSATLTLMIVNGVGSFIIGYISRYHDAYILLFVGVGFCGALTTFSSFALVVMTLFEEKAWLALIICLLGNNIISLFCCWLGRLF